MPALHQEQGPGPGTQGRRQDHRHPRARDGPSSPPGTYTVQCTHTVRVCTLYSLHQRIYSISYTEWAATPFVFYKVPPFPRKPEIIRKTTPELLLAEW